MVIFYPGQRTLYLKDPLQNKQAEMCGMDVWVNQCNERPIESLARRLNEGTSERETERKSHPWNKSEWTDERNDRIKFHARVND